MLTDNIEEVLALNWDYGWDTCTVPGFMKTANMALLQQTEVFDRHTRGPAVLQSGGHCMRVQHCYRV